MVKYDNVMLVNISVILREGCCQFKLDKVVDFNTDASFDLDIDVHFSMCVFCFKTSQSYVQEEKNIVLSASCGDVLHVLRHCKVAEFYNEAYADTRTCPILIPARG